jgi:hypothetical protein
MKRTTGTNHRPTINSEINMTESSFEIG